MKTTSKLGIIALATTVLVAGWSPQAFAQGPKASSFSLLGDPVVEAPKTTAEKLKDLQRRHETAYGELAALMNRLPVEPEMLGTKDLFALVDQSSRDMKNIRTGCSSLMTSLKSQAKSIQEGSSFDAKQKEELLKSAEVLAGECKVLSDKLDLATKRLDEAYTVLPKWNKIYKSYQNLQGEVKASEEVKAQVEGYLKSFVAVEKEAETKDTPAGT